jgi:hypothetical protein
MGGALVKISIFSLIYKSTRYADAVYESVHRHTQELADGSAEFFFVANLATDRVKEHLIEKGYPHFVHDDGIALEEFEAGGFAPPAYMCNVYRGYNFGISKCRGEIVVPVNSDHLFSPNWLTNLLARLDRKTVPASLLVEPGHRKYGVFKDAVGKNFGKNPDQFDEKAFLDFVESISEDVVSQGGAYMPCAFYKDALEAVGGYPNGNLLCPPHDRYIHVRSHRRRVYGDIALFFDLKQAGFQHVTVRDSIVYHFKEGELDE